MRPESRDLAFSRYLLARKDYSYRRASTGSMRAALIAGSIPLTIPTNARMMVDRSRMVGSMCR